MARKMKDSGIEWIGEIPEEWKVSLLKYSIQWKSERGNPDATVLSLYRDYGVVPKDSRDDNHNVTSLDTSGYKCVEPGDLVINKMKAWQGSLAVSGYTGIVSPAYHVCRITDSRIDKQYLHHLLRTPAYLPEYSRLSTGMRIGQWDLGFDDFKNIPFVIPPLEEQQRIVTFLINRLDYIESVIEQTRSSIEEYKKLKQAVITQAVTKGVRGDRPMKDSGIDYLGEMPENWRIASINHIFSFVGGYAFQSDRFCSETSYQVIRIGNVKNDKLLLHVKEAYIDDAYASVAKNCQIHENDILFTMTGTKGKQDYFYTLLVSKCDLFDKKLYLNQRVGCFRTRDNDSCARYYNYLLKDQRIKDYIFLYETGTANQGNLGIETIKRTKLLIPTYDEQNEIADYLDIKCAEIDALIAKKEEIIVQLKNYKKSMIYEYVTGKKEVPLSDL